MCPLQCWSSTPVTRSRWGGCRLYVPLRRAKLHFRVLLHGGLVGLGLLKLLLNFLFLLAQNHLSNHCGTYELILSAESSKLGKLEEQGVHEILCPAKSRTTYSMWWGEKERECSFRIFLCRSLPSPPLPPPPAPPVHLWSLDSYTGCLSPDAQP